MDFEKNSCRSLVCEMELFAAFSALRKWVENGKISLEGRQANAAIAEQCGVLTYSI